MAFEDTVIPIKVTTDTAQLKQLIRDFDGSTEAALKLRAATDEVNNTVNVQKKAILAVNSATRVQQFQYIEGLRLLRSTTSLFANLNSVYQTTILRQIAATQTTVAQQQAFEGIIRFAGNYVNALGILGPANEQVKAGLDDLINSADQLDSKKIETLIEAYVRAGAEANLSGEGLVKFNEGLAILKKLLDETKLEEKNKEFQDFTGTMIQLGQAAGGLGTFAIQLSKIEGIAALFKPGSAAGLGIAAIVGLLSIPGILEMLGFEKNTTSPITGAKINVKSLDEIVTDAGKVAQDAQRKIEFHINNPTFNSDLDINKAMDFFKAKLLQEQGFGTIQ